MGVNEMAHQGTQIQQKEKKSQVIIYAINPFLFRVLFLILITENTVHYPESIWSLYLPPEGAGAGGRLVHNDKPWGCCAVEELHTGRHYQIHRSH